MISNAMIKLTIKVFAVLGLWLILRRIQPDPKALEELEIETYDFDIADGCSNYSNISLASSSRNQSVLAVPKIVHYIFGLDQDFGGKEFGFIHFVSIYLTFKIIKPDEIFFHYRYLPQYNRWWNLASPFVTAVPARDLSTYKGISITQPFHRADILRLEILLKHGGIYLDLDVIPLRPFDALLTGSNVVMGWEGGTRSGLCNAIILATPQAEFLKQWLSTYTSFDPTEWNRHSIKIPAQLASSSTNSDDISTICILPPHAFFFPLWTKRHISWMHAPLTTAETKSEFNRSLIRDKHGSVMLYDGQYAYHAWEQMSWSYLKDLDFRRLSNSEVNTRFGILLRAALDGVALS